MKGPYEMSDQSGFLPLVEHLWEGGCMKRGERYRVIRGFTDGDGDEHAVGEEWLFLGSSYSIYDEMRLLYVSISPGEAWIFPLFTDPTRQKAVSDEFCSYVHSISQERGHIGIAG